MRYVRSIRPGRSESLPTFIDDELRKIQDAFIDQADVVMGELTLANGTTSTEVTHARIRSDAIIHLTPKSAAAAAFLVSVYQDTTVNGSVTLTHTDPGVDLDFNYTINIPLNTITR